MKPLNKSESKVYDRMCKELRYSLETMQEVRNAVSVFGSARTKPNSAEYKTAYQMGKLLGENGYNVITGGGPGNMEAANKGAYEVGVKSVGLNIILPHEQAPNPYQNVSVTFHYFAIRKVCFVKYAKAFIICPGGYGTLDEFFEVLTLIQNGGSKQYPVVLLGKKFWMPMYYWLKGYLLATGKINEKDVKLFTVADTPEEALQMIRSK